jgi:hypothetical protein
VYLRPPNCEKQIETTLAETAQAIIKRNLLLELHYLVSAPRTMKELPSWVPDHSTCNFAWVPGFDFKSATKDSEARFSFDGHGRITIYMFRMDVVKSKTEALNIRTVVGNDSIETSVPSGRTSGCTSDFFKDGISLLGLLKMCLNYRCKHYTWSSGKR